MAKKKPLTTEEWVSKLNALGAEIDGWAAMTHPGVWAEQLGSMLDRYRALAAQPTEDREQLSLMDTPS